MDNAQQKWVQVRTAVWLRTQSAALALALSLSGCVAPVGEASEEEETVDTIKDSVLADRCVCQCGWPPLCPENPGSAEGCDTAIFALSGAKPERCGDAEGKACLGWAITRQTEDTTEWSRAQDTVSSCFVVSGRVSSTTKKMACECSGVGPMCPRRDTSGRCRDPFYEFSTSSYEDRTTDDCLGWYKSVTGELTQGVGTLTNCQEVWSR